MAASSIPRVEQAGAIVVRASKGVPRILLVTARRNPGNWIFPKGHVERGETRKQAAVREAREEAGVDGDVAGRAGTMTFDFSDRRYRVHYFVVTTEDAGKEREGRQLRWCRYEQALKRLTFDETRELLRGAWPTIKKATAARRSRSSKRKQS